MNYLSSVLAGVEAMRFCHYISILFASLTFVNGQSNVHEQHELSPKKKPKFEKRNILGDILHHENFTTGAELGVLRGVYALQLLRSWKSCEKFYLIDCWKSQSNYSDYANNDNHEENYNITLRNLHPFLDKIEVLRMLTSEAAKVIKDSSLDFVYIDARHDYCGVKADINYYWPKIRPGGIMAGHGGIASLP